MKIENLNFVKFKINSQEVNNLKNTQNKDFSSIIQMKDVKREGIEIPRNSSKEIIQNFSEWYFKMGKTYENSKDYKQAISAYEKSYTVKPDITKAQTADGVKSKLTKKEMI